MAKPRRKQDYTPALLENLRTRFEETDESIVDIAASVPISHTTLRLLARERGWTKFVPPPLDLTPAAKLAAEAAQLAAQAATASTLPPRSGGEGRPAVRQHGEAGWGALAGIAQTQDGSDVRPPPTPDPSPPRAGGGEENAASPSDLSRAGGGDGASTAFAAGEDNNAAAPSSPHATGNDTPPDLSNLAPEARMARLSHLLRMLDVQIAKLRRKQALPQRDHEMKEINAELNKLVAGHSHLEQKLDDLQRGRPIQTPGNDDDDIPEDIDAFRLDLARRIREFVASRAAGRDAAGDRPAPPVDDVS